jgi:hypothetical protein
VKNRVLLNNILVNSHNERIKGVIWSNGSQELAIQCEDGRFRVSTISYVALLNRGSLTSSETGDSSGVRSGKEAII